MEGFLLVMGALALLVGLVALIEGRFRCLGVAKRKKVD
jgi:hypothetical protein